VFGDCRATELCAVKTQHVLQCCGSMRVELVNQWTYNRNSRSRYRRCYAQRRPGVIDGVSWWHSAMLWCCWRAGGTAPLQPVCHLRVENTHHRAELRVRRQRGGHTSDNHPLRQSAVPPVRRLTISRHRLNHRKLITLYGSSEIDT